MALRDKYQQAIYVAQQVPLQGATIEEKDNKLIIKGSVASEEGGRRIENAVRQVLGWEDEVILNIQIDPDAGARQGGTSTYTVRKGDTLSAIARDHLGDAGAYKEIFEANRDQLSDPDEIKPGQVLKIPQMARRRS